jgi:hypothetical protein
MDVHSPLLVDKFHSTHTLGLPAKYAGHTLTILPSGHWQMSHRVVAPWRGGDVRGLPILSNPLLHLSGFEIGLLGQISKLHGAQFVGIGLVIIE